MVQNHNLSQRKQLRLKNYDYSSCGGYYVTICTFERMCLFGNVLNDEMVLNDFGKIVRDEWQRSAIIRNEIQLDEFVVMPNHIHGIIVIENNVGATGRFNVGATGRLPLRTPGPSKYSLGSLVAGFKSSTTKKINVFRNTPTTHIWQRNYGSTGSPSLEPSRAKSRGFDHIIRNDKELDEIREYIRNNPMNWNNDSENIA